MKEKILFVISLLFVFQSKAQMLTDTLANHNITIAQDSMIKVLMEYTSSVASSKMTTDGYRIQLASNPNRKSVQDLKAQFLSLYPDVRAYLEYNQPTFRLRVGDFETRIAAYAFQQKILQQFPNGFIVPDQISLGEK